jgi:hypothetical protein
MSVADEIAKLHELLARGAISQADYERAKARLLDAWIWRMLFVLGLVFGGFTLFAYVVLWIFVPNEDV